MTPLDPDGGASPASVAPPAGGAAPRRRTLPPPEWERGDGPRSAASLALARHEGEKPVSRRVGPRAEQAWLEAQVRAASASGDAEAEREASAALARLLAARGTELDTATKLARRALLLGEDAALRDELSTWLAALGEAALAAATLRPLIAPAPGSEAAKTLVRSAVLLCRAGAVAEAVAALDDAAKRDEADPTALELLGAIGGWAPEAVDAARAAGAYLDAAARREAMGDRAAAFEDLLRATEADPSHDGASRALARVLRSRGRGGAADVVLYLHARAGGARRAELHGARLRAAAERGDLAGAVTAGLDAALEAAEGSSDALAFDALLERAGLAELLAARIDVDCDGLIGSELARRRMELARLYAGPLASPERASRVWLEALVADPSSQAARAALREHATSLRDQTPLVEALIRVGLGEGSAVEERIQCLRELAVLAEQRLGDPALAAWAVRRIGTLGWLDDELASTAKRLAPRVRLQDEALAAAREALLASTAGDRPDALRRVAGILRGRPDAVEEYLATLVELVSLAPAERTWQVALERVLERTGRFDELEALLGRLAGQARSRTDEERVRAALAALRRRRGDWAGAFRELSPLLEGGGAHSSAWCMGMVLAARLGDGASRARALLRIASTLAPALRAALTGVAADALLEAGELVAARAAAEQASHVDPALARPVATLAAIALVAQDASSPRALERAMGVIVPRAELCRALADSYEGAGEGALAIVWTQRWLTLTPGAPAAAHALLRRVLAAGDPARVADALGWLLSQPRSQADVSPMLSSALPKLARVDSARASALARRALDVIGPVDDVLRATLLLVAEELGEPGLGIAVLERWLAAGTADTDHAAILLELAERRRRAGDADGAARALTRALGEGAAPASVLAAVEHALPVRSSDGELSLLRARAEALAELPEAELGGAVRAARDYGAALWDLAGDPAGAIDAWERAARLLGDAGAAQLARDLVAFAGSEDAIGRLEALAGRQQEPTRAAALLVEAATLSLQSGERARALALALRATELDASRPEALAAVERSAGPDDVDALERVYGRIAAAALGCYGERAVHYRAARQLERRGELGRALEHAIRAFEAFPTEGVTYVLAARLANRMGEPAELVRALERVASKCKTTEASAAWLRRAAALSGSGEEGQRQRVDVLLRALAAVPDVETVRTLGAAMSALVASGFEEREIVELRFARAQGTLLPRLEGPEGARIAIESARTALESFGSARLGVLALARAARCDGDLEEFATLAPYARALATAGEAPGLVSALVAQANDRFAGAGSALTELGAEIARVLGDLRSVATLLVVAALGRPGDSSLAERAAEAVEELGDPELAAKLVDVVPEAERVAKLFEVAARAESDGDLATAMSALERIRDSAELAPERRQPAVRRLTALYGRAGRRDALESMLAAELARADVVGADRLRVTRDLAALVAARGDLRRGLELVTELMRDHVDDEAVLGDVIELASQAGERRLQADALARLADLTREPTARAALLRKLAPLLETLGDTAPAFERWSQLSGLTPDDPAALEALERELERRGDHERLAALLARRASLATMVDDVRRLRLRRATVLEQRLGRPDEARAELQALLATTGDNLGVLRVLADLEERLGAMLAAAPLWLRASAVARERAEAAALARRSAEAYLAGGDVDSAGRVLEGLEAWAESPALAELAVEVRRRGNDPLALAAALEELALGSSESPEARAALLLEAAQASEAGGDDEAALSRAEQATELCPRLAAAQLAAARLRYLRGGVGDKERARVTVAELRGARGALAPADEELKAFLTAEALDVAVGGDASLRELRRAELDLGPRPLVALALAERLARGEHVELSLSLFEAALAGDLARMRSRGRVALEAASAARRTGEPELALTFLEVAASDADTRAEALGAAAAVRAERLGPDRRSSSHEGPAVAAARSTSRPPPSSGSRYAERGATPAESAAEPAPVRRTSRPPAELPELPAGVESLRPARSPRASIVIEAASATEASLLDALARGSIEAGKELIQQLENRAGRSHDLLGVCRRVALLVPGDVWVLEKLHEAALTDHNQVHARALEHVLALFDPARAATAPPRLPDQPGHLEQVTSMLFRDLMTPALEALAIVWEGAEHVFRRDPGTYGITGLERVPLGAPTALGHVYTGAARALGLMRAPLFQRRSSPGSIALSVALLSPPALIVSGEVRSETPELWFHVGSMLAATLPQHALLFGSPESQTRAVLRGLALAFGSPSPSRSGELGAAAHLAEVLWESVPARLQRRLRELCDEPESLDYDAALAAGRRAIRRAGLYVAGDLGVALRETCADDGIPLRTLEEPGGLAALSSSSLAVADLLRLATSSQYAEARFQPERSRG